MSQAEIEVYRLIDEQDRELNDPDFIEEGPPSISRVRLVPITRKIGDPCRKNGCQGHFVERVNKKTGELFLGCSRFPNCKNSASL